MKHQVTVVACLASLLGGNGPQAQNIQEPARLPVESPARLDFLANVPEFREFTLSMTESDLQEIIARKTLNVRLTPEGNRNTYQVWNAEGENVFIGFQDGKCTGIQRMQQDPALLGRMEKHSRKDPNQRTEPLIFNIGDTARQVQEKVASLAAFHDPAGNRPVEERSLDGDVVIRAHAQLINQESPEDMIFLFSSNGLYQAEFQYRCEEPTARAALFDRLLGELKTKYPDIAIHDHPPYRKLADVYSSDYVVDIAMGMSDYEPIKVMLRPGIHRDARGGGK